jgi:hypothetical protein
MSAIKLSTPSSGSISLSPADTASNLTITVPANAGTMITTGSTFAGTGPAFSASSTTSLTLTSGVWYKVIFNQENFDTNNNYDPTTNYRFTPTVAGYYQINSCVAGDAVTNTNIWTMAIAKNGTRIASGSQAANNVNNGQASMCSFIVYCNGSTDYIEIFAIQTSGTNINTSTGIGTFFNGFLARAA